MLTRNQVAGEAEEDALQNNETETMRVNNKRHEVVKLHWKDINKLTASLTDTLWSAKVGDR